MDNAKEKAALAGTGTASRTTFDKHHDTPPVTSGQCSEIFNLIRQRQAIVSPVLTADHAIPEAAARVHNLRAMGFSIPTTIHLTVIFRVVEQLNMASYSLGTPEWPRHGFFERGENANG